MTVRLRGRLPAEEMNGLEKHESDLSANPTAKRIVVGVIDVYERRDHHGDGDFQPTIELLQIEVLDGRLRERGLKLLQQAYGKRTGSRQLAGFDDDALDEDGAPTAVTSPPATPPGPRFSFEPAADGKWWLVYADSHGEVLARRGGLGVRAELTLGREYTLDEIDALHDDDLSTLARALEQESADSEFESAAPVGGDEHDQADVSQYADEDVAATVAVDEIPGPEFSDRKEKQDA